jgi:metal-responsive CopG/Arc/MetJ family transcriptional regulator
MKHRYRKVRKPLDFVLVQVQMTRELREAADKVARWDLMDRSEYIRSLILADVRRRNALPQEERT